MPKIVLRSDTAGGYNVFYIKKKRGECKGFDLCKVIRMTPTLKNIFGVQVEGSSENRMVKFQIKRTIPVQLDFLNWINEIDDKIEKNLKKALDKEGKTLIYNRIISESDKYPPFIRLKLHYRRGRYETLFRLDNETIDFDSFEVAVNRKKAESKIELSYVYTKESKDDPNVIYAGSIWVIKEINVHTLMK